MYNWIMNINELCTSIISYYYIKTKSVFFLSTLTEKITLLIGTKPFLHDCGHNGEGHRIVFMSNN